MIADADDLDFRVALRLFCTWKIQVRVRYDGGKDVAQTAVGVIQRYDERYVHVGASQEHFTSIPRDQIESITVRHQTFYDERTGRQAAKIQTVEAVSHTRQIQSPYKQDIPTGFLGC